MRTQTVVVLGAMVAALPSLADDTLLRCVTKDRAGLTRDGELGPVNAALYDGPFIVDVSTGAIRFEDGGFGNWDIVARGDDENDTVITPNVKWGPGAVTQDFIRLRAWGDVNSSGDLVPAPIRYMMVRGTQVLTGTCEPVRVVE